MILEASKQICVCTFHMTVKTRPSTYRISLAPTSRACCRKCKQAIHKDAVRLEICVFVRPGRYTLLLRCASCIDSAMALAILKVYKSASRVPAEPSVDQASATRVRNHITTCSKGSTIVAATRESA